MPFTPLHLGPALALGLSFRKYIHLPTFIIANVIVDIEPFLVLVLRLNYPLHGYLHTFVFASVLGLALSYVMFKLEKFLNSLYRSLLLVPQKLFNFRAFAIAGILGTIIHILLDSPLYMDIRPFYPLNINPLYNPKASFRMLIMINSICVLMGIVGLTYYAGLIIYLILKRRCIKNNNSISELETEISS